VLGVADTQIMEMLHASYRVISASIVAFLATAAVLATFFNAVIAVALIQTREQWPTAFAVAYLILAVAVPAFTAYRGRRRGKARLGLARNAVFASLALNLFVAPVTLGALAM
jgi:hypothetical protein